MRRSQQFPGLRDFGKSIKLPQRAVVRACSFLVLTVGLVACSQSTQSPQVKGSRQVSSSQPTTTRLEALPIGRSINPSVSLADLLLPAQDPVLKGFKVAPDGDYEGTGALSLQDAARAEDDFEAEESLLSTRGFEAGFGRVFNNAQDDVIFVTVYRFAEASGAAAYLVDGAERLLARGAVKFPVDQPEDAFGFTQTETQRDETFTGHGVAYAFGQFVFLIVAGSTDASLTVDDARAVAYAQAKRALQFASA